MESNIFNSEAFRNRSKENLAQSKRKLKLDLNLPSSAKKLRPGSINPLLTSPDLNMLKLASPELEQLVLDQVPTGIGPHMFSQATHEQEEFAKGFVDSLEEMHNQNSSCSSTSQSSVNSAVQYTTLHPPDTEFKSQQIKQEPQSSLNNSPPLSPINMENQEMIKLERKRMRNRIAASKCRRRKLERIGRLEDKVSILKGENNDLQAVLNKLREQVYALKKEVMDHVDAGCKISIGILP